MDQCGDSQGGVHGGSAGTGRGASPSTDGFTLIFFGL